MEKHKPSKIMPLYVDFAVTFKCNAKCQHCSLAADYYEETQQSRDMSTETILCIIDELANSGVMMIGFTGGEAILREDIFEIIKYCSQKGILTAIASNGLALTKDVIDELIYCHIGSLFVSLDHYEESIHEHIRGQRGVFAGVVGAIEYCVLKKIPITVGITPMKDNFKEIEKTIEFISLLGVETINISNFVPTGRGVAQYDLSPDEWKELYIKLNKCIKKYPHIRFQIHDVKRNILEKLSESREDEYIGCTAGYAHCYILPNGDVRPCVMLPVNLGNILEESLQTILQKYQESDMVINKEKLEGKCGKCRFKYKCGGCRAVAYAYTKNLLGEDKHCWITNAEE